MSYLVLMLVLLKISDTRSIISLLLVTDQSVFSQSEIITHFF